jgi:two-component system, chemotaxis family, response regulator Rcp1
MQPINFFLVEDNEGDIMLINEALLEAKILNKMEIARDGAQAIKLLEEKAQLGPDALPDIILLDINLPKKNGHEVLDSLKNNPDLKHIPIIVLTTSSSEMDIFKAYDMHANCYIIKPVEVENFLQVINKIEDFWLTVVKLPKQKMK